MGGCHINFAYTSIPWCNEAINKAVVTFVIVGFSRKKYPICRIYSIQDNKVLCKQCEKISPYLNERNSIIVEKQSKALSKITNLVKGSQPTDDGNLLFSYQEGLDFLKKYPEAKLFVKKFIGATELVKGEHRFCLWLDEKDQAIWSKNPEILRRIENVRNFRLLSSKKATVKLSEKPWAFSILANPSNPPSALVIPGITSENRYYIPMDFVKGNTIVSNRCFILSEATNYEFGILTSRMHMCWMRHTCGRMKTDYSYSRDLTYNTFIWPNATDLQKQEIIELAKNIRRCRAMHAPTCLGELYNDNSMPQDLKKAHLELDHAVEHLYRDEPFQDDEERLAFMLDLYSKAIAAKGSK